MDNVRTIHYKFKFGENDEKDFAVQMDSKTLDLVCEPQDSYPDWARLEYQKCSNCPLSSSEHEYCPVAKKLTGTVDYFCKPLGSADVDLSVETPERTYCKKTDLKSASVSLIGIYMATSDCPIMDKLRPMARHHLPLATTPETTYRSIANYLIGQYLSANQGKEADWDLKDLGKIYDDIKTVNTYFRERLLTISSEDYALNAILTLDAHAYYINLSLIGDTFYTIENLFDNALQSRIISYDSQGPSAPSSEVEKYQFQFGFRNNFVKEFTYGINTDSLSLVHKKGPTPSWTKLGCQKCPNCPFDENMYPYCPAAMGIAGAIDALNETLTIQEAEVVVKTAQRDFKKATSVADGLSAMFDLVMVTSGCPVLSKLRPLIRNYLPFVSSEEKVYRHLGMYLLRQKFAETGKNDPDRSLNGFAKFYEDINAVSKAFASRLREITLDEDSLNVLATLECFKQYDGFMISESNISDLQALFAKSF